jgi:hypothetical protein
MADLLASDTDLASALQRDVDTSSAILALEVCTAVVQAAAGQRIVRVVDDTVRLWGGADQVLRLPERPIVSVASVTYGGVLLSQGTASGTWRLDPNGIWRDVGWIECPGEPWPTDVVYTHGLTADQQDIELARGTVLSLAKPFFTNPDGTIREAIDDYSVAYAEAEMALEMRPGAKDRLRKKYGRKGGMVRIV